MAELKDIDKGLKRFEKLAYDRLAEAQVKIAIKMLEAVAGDTPVDTSRCQSNWTLSENKTGAIYTPYPQTEDNTHADKRGRAFFAVVSEAKQDGVNIAKRIRLGRKIRPVYIHNPTPYLKYLNKGHSAQTRAGFIKANAQRAYRKQTAILNQVLGDTLGARVK